MNGVNASVHHNPGRFLFGLLLGLLALFGSACSSTQLLPGEQQENDTRNQLVARDLLFVMSQILDPNETTFQVGKPSTSFGRELDIGFREIGYGMQRVSADQGPNFMSYTESASVSNSGENTYKYSVFVGDIGLERSYTQLADVGFVPYGPMIVYGSRKSVLLNDLIFPDQSTEVSYRNNEDAEVEDALITVFDSEVANAIADLRRQTLPSYKTFNSQQQDIQNLFTRGSSNFEALGRNYRVVRREVISFGDDSLFLRRKGRAQIQKIVKFYLPDSDLIRVVGCSNGPTHYDGGNIALAQGRSARVAEELVKRQVDKKSILDEGCWSGESAGDRFPDRGVIVELQRQN